MNDNDDEMGYHNRMFNWSLGKSTEFPNLSLYKQNNTIVGHFGSLFRGAGRSSFRFFLALIKLKTFIEVQNNRIQLALK